MKNKNTSITEKKMSVFVIVLGIFATILRLFLTKGMLVYFVSGTQYDDMLQISKAFSIAKGEWLGSYGPLTLVKGVGYPLLTAIFHFIGMPYILGFHLIYVLGSIVFAWAIRPVVKNKFVHLLVYIFVLFNPIAFSTAITKFYRDILYYALCMIFISVMLGLLIRQKGCIAAWASGFALACCALCREDCQWLYVYAICCVIAVFTFKSISDRKFYSAFFRETVCMVMSYLLVVLTICGINYKYYRTFVPDEYNSGSYAKAYGAISRLHGEEGNTQIVIPYSEREKLYEYSQAFAQLKPYLDGDDPKYEVWKIVNDDYRTGYFSFTLREAIADAGYYKESRSTNEYLDKLASEVNDYCDNVSENAYGKRKGITSRFYFEYIPYIADSTLKGIKYTLSYRNVSCIPIQCEEDNVYLKIFEEFTNSTIAGNRYMENGEIYENYHLTGFSRWMQRLMRVIILFYRIITPLLFAISFPVVLWQTILIFRKCDNANFTSWIAVISLLALFITRCIMIGFVDATTFAAVDNPAYQAGSYVALGCFVSVSLALLADDFINKIKLKKR